MKALKYFSVSLWGIILGFVCAYVLFYSYYYLFSGTKINFFSRQTHSQTATPLKPNPISVTPVNNTPAKTTVALTTNVNVPILMYHYIKNPNNLYNSLEVNLSVLPTNFQTQMQYLSDQGYSTISLYQLAEAINEGKAIPKKSVVITFDDGYSDLYKNAYPILKQYNYTATVFLIARKIDARGGYLSSGQIIELQNNGFELGSHTSTHRNLLSLDSTQALLEILKSKEELQRLFNTTIYFFCYPIGRYNNYIVSLVQDAGYLGAVTTLGGFAQKNSALYTLPRVRISGRDTISSFAQKIGSL